MYSGGFLRPASQSSTVLSGIPRCTENCVHLSPGKKGQAQLTRVTPAPAEAACIQPFSNTFHRKSEIICRIIIADSFYDLPQHFLVSGIHIGRHCHLTSHFLEMVIHSSIPPLSPSARVSAFLPSHNQVRRTELPAPSGFL